MHDADRTPPAISVRGLTKRYGGRAAVDGLDLDIERGEVFALLGPNGAGKTTTVEVLEGYRRRDGGTVSVLGHDPETAGTRWRARLGIVLQEHASFELLTVTETVEHFAAFYPHPMPAAEVIDLVDLGEAASTRAGKLSGGQRRRLDVACGLVGRPELLFLDEPTTGLDPEARRRLWGVIRRLRESGTTIVLTTHYLDEAEVLADRVGVIAAGRLVEVAPPQTLGGRARAAAVVTFRASGPLAGVGLPDAVVRLGDSVAATDDGRWRVETMDPTATVVALAEWAGAHGGDGLPELQVLAPTLEDVYLRLLGEAGSGTSPEEARSA